MDLLWKGSTVSAGLVNGLRVQASAEAASAALQRVGSLARESAANTATLVQDGACAAVMETAQAYPADASVVSSGCFAVHSLIFGSGAPDGDTRRRLLGAAGGCQFAVGALRLFPHDATVVENACWAMKNLAAGEGAADRVDALVSAGAVELMVATLKAYGGSGDAAHHHPGLLTHACGVVCNMSPTSASNPAHLAALSQAGACEATTAVLKAFITSSSSTTSPEAVAAVVAACWAMCSLAAGGAETRSRLFAAGACEAVVKAWKLFPSHTAVVEYACGAAINLTSGVAFEDAAAHLVTAGALPLAVSALRDASAANQAAWLLTNLASR